MVRSTTPDNFYLYLWRSKDLPGTLYLAEGFEVAEALCRGLTEDGYIVKVVRLGTDIEFELCDGMLCPTTQSSRSRGPSTSNRRMSPAYV
jgi:hypothetical protein